MKNFQTYAKIVSIVIISACSFCVCFGKNVSIGIALPKCPVSMSVVSKGGNYTKHIYIGNQRIVSKLGDLDSYGADPRRIEYAGSNVDGASINYGNKYSALQQTIKDRYAKFEVEYYGKDNDDYVNGQGFCCDDTPQNAPMRAPQSNDNPELFQYYYHSDHLGSTSLITNLDGEVVQHIEYVPFGEVFIEERNNKWNTPYLFNAKELDEETGLYYYGARYYDPRVSLWLSFDPPLIDGSYFDGEINGGVYNSFNLNGYIYCYQNPVILVETEGTSPTVVTAAIGAVAGGIIGGGIEMFSQWRKNGKITNWRAVAGSAAGGAVTGGMIGLTGGASLAVTAVGVGLATVEGGLVNDMVQGKQSTVGSVATDFVVGATFGAGGKLLANGLGGLANGIKQATTKLTEAAKKAANIVGNGKGAVHGTNVHTQFSKLVNGMKIGENTIKTEVSYLNGQVVKHGTKGSARIDAGLYDSKGNLIQVFDLKTGCAKLTQEQVKHIQTQTRTQVPVTEIRGN
ncbi:hypothetical protein FACS189429_1740 [Bacteroidia bacterium]|nr:hypothetical protein FACS189429_1740 [Bacteroidia bacterium]GHV45183.1 hypothetical protein FACS1894180_7440 [Bacteroidia bacterium]